MMLIEMILYNNNDIKIYNYDNVKDKVLRDMVPDPQGLFMIKLGSMNINDFKEHKRMTKEIEKILWNVQFDMNSLMLIQKDDKYYMFGGTDINLITLNKYNKKIFKHNLDTWTVENAVKYS